MTNKHRVSIYGNTASEKAYCFRCKGMAFVLDGKMACCDATKTTSPEKIVRESQPFFKRIRISNEEKENILSSQDYKCIFCERPFGSLVFRKSRAIRLRIHYDHFLPFVYSANNKTDNLHAACHVCNSIKTSRHFTSIDEAKLFLKNKWEEKGFYE